MSLFAFSTTERPLVVPLALVRTWWSRWLALRVCLLGLVLLLGGGAYAQEPALLPKSAMYADFDTLTASLQRISPHLRLKQKLWHYDARAQLRTLRKSIDTVRSATSFALLLNRALTACQDYHTTLLDLPPVYRQADNQASLYLPLAYIEGEYVLTKSFSSEGQRIPVGATLTRVGERAIDGYVTGLVTEKVLRYDLKRKKFYSETFYLNQQTLFADTIPLTFQTPAGNLIGVRLPLKEKLHFIYPIADTIRNQVTYWPDKQVLYVKLYRMDEALIPKIQTKLAAFRHHPQPVQRIILDLRDNTGGNDAVWQALYEAILPAPVHYPLRLAGLRPTHLPTAYLTQMELRRDSIRADRDAVPRSFHLYTFYRGNATLTPTDSSLHFTGKVIVLGNENNYSSGASAFSLPQAYPNDQLILLSRPTGMFLGMGYAPVELTLPNSGLHYRVEPAVETTGVRTMADLMHDSSEVVVPWTREEVYQREAYRGNTLGADFLKTRDPFIQRALGL